MTVYEYITRNLPNLNWNILPQIFEENGVELTEDIEKYLRETPGNTNWNLLRGIINKDERFIDPNEFLIRISQNLIQENVNSFNLINRFGDKNEKFYMILEGKISVLSIKESE